MTSFCSENSPPFLAVTRKLTTLVVMTRLPIAAVLNQIRQFTTYIFESDIGHFVKTAEV